MKKYLILFFVAVAAVFQSCDNNDDLWDAIDDLKSRVQALETQVDALNGNIEALQKLYGGATISKVENSGGKYTITLTNGEIIELVQGSEAEAVIPIISINDKGEWQVSTDNGATFTSLGVKAVAEDGTTPQFRIDEATGYWQVSYDGGKTFENVLDTNKKPVEAIGSGTVTDKFFDTVKVDGDDFYIKLLDGTELRIPILSDFFCRIVMPTSFCIRPVKVTVCAAVTYLVTASPRLPPTSRSGKMPQPPLKVLTLHRHGMTGTGSTTSR